MTELVLTLIVAPMVCALGLFCLRGKGGGTDWIRRVLVVAGVLVVCVASVMLAMGRGGGQSETRPSGSVFLQNGVGLHVLPNHHDAIHWGIMAIELLMAAYVLYVGIRSKKWFIVILMVAQAGLMGWFELTMTHGGGGEILKVPQDLFVDKFAIIMALINGLVGGGICLYALGYMKDYHAGSGHKDVADRRSMFFTLLFIFMGAMFGLIFSNNLMWLFLFWEITTLCSYLLIGYTRTPEAKRNALRALWMNLLGGLAFAIAIVLLQRQTGATELQEMLKLASNKTILLLPAALLCFAGISKAAQLPFSNWLLGAMVAPTPVSALLHSSTMVKAGVYLVLRMSPIVTGTGVGLIVAVVGGVTFLIGSLAAITASDAKRVLAWSTVANLGLIVLCGGVGTYAAVWAGVLLIIFHAVAKCLLFLCVGVVEHKLHSRDVDAMSALIVKMPLVGGMMLIGMAGMFLAPFGMLISKWAVLKAVVDASPSLSLLVVFGSSATLFFWVKWMGKLVQTVGIPDRIRHELHAGEAVAMCGLTVLTFLACVLFPLISLIFIEPYVDGLPYSNVPRELLGSGNVTIMILMMGMVMLFPLSMLFRSRGGGVKIVDPYLCGANVEGSIKFVGSGGTVETMAMNNYYMRNLLSERLMMGWGSAFCTVILAAMLAVMAVQACR